MVVTFSLKPTECAEQKCGINFEVTFVKTVRPIFKTDIYETNMLLDNENIDELERSGNLRRENIFQ